MGLLPFRIFCLYLVLVLRTSAGVSQNRGRIYPGFQTSQKDWVEENGLFLLSKNSTFAFGFYTALDGPFLLVVIHKASYKVVWTANRGGRLVSNSDRFVFDKGGDVCLQNGTGVAWCTGTRGQSAAYMELMDSGNLVLRGENGSILWQSFSHPTDTLLVGQEFVEGMKLKSLPYKDNLFSYLEIKNGSVVLYAGYRTPQVYWSLENDSRKTNKSVDGKVHSASLGFNYWNFYDQRRVLLRQFMFSQNADPNAKWAAILGPRGNLMFYNLQNGRSVTPEATKIPPNSCGIPEPCDRYVVCSFDNWCQCPSELRFRFNCRPPVASICNESSPSVELIHVGERLDYFALEFVAPSSKSDLDGCKQACLRNCSCIVLFHENSTGKCFLFDQVGSLTRAQQGSPGYVSFMKVSSSELNAPSHINGGKHAIVVAFIVIATVMVIGGMMCAGNCYYRKKKGLMRYAQDNLKDDDDDDDDILGNFPGRPVRYTYNELCKATKNFTMKIGQGGFGSVYLGVLSDGTQLAVKKLEGIGQGLKEFKAEVNIIGSVHHVHLVNLKGFCTEGDHRLLVYEYMGKGSLDKWIFKNNEENSSLDWNTRFNIAVGTAKGLAYLHEECEVKIVHCDIKPQNVLLDDNFTVKVSDFGMAKLINREESQVYTTVRGTRGYLAPEWITHKPISEKSDVYSYGIVLLEIIGGRKNYESGESSERSHFPSYSFKMLEEGKLREIIDPKLDTGEDDDRVVTAIKVALWCMQDEMQMRPPMTKVVQMLEGLSPVPEPPACSPSCVRAYPSFIRWNSREGSTSGLTDDYRDESVSNGELSGPR